MWCSYSGSADVHLPGPSRLLMLIDGPPLWPPWAFFSCSSRRSSWNTRELFSVPRASSIVCFWISVSVSWWRRFSSSVWLLLIVLFVNCQRHNGFVYFQVFSTWYAVWLIKKVTDLVPELLDFILSVLDSALQSCFSSVMLFLQVLYLLGFKTNQIQSAWIRVSGKQTTPLFIHYLLAVLKLNLCFLFGSGLRFKLLLKLQVLFPPWFGFRHGLIL